MKQRLRFLFAFALFAVGFHAATSSARAEEPAAPVGQAALMKTMEGFRAELPPPRTLAEGNGVSIEDADGKRHTINHLDGIAGRLGVKRKADCLVLLSYLKDRDPKIRSIAAFAIEKAVKAYPNGMSTADVLKMDSDGHREMVIRFIEAIETMNDKELEIGLPNDAEPEMVKDLRLLRKTVARQGPSLPAQVSSVEAQQAAARIFDRVRFMGMRKRDVLWMLGDPKTISGLGVEAGPNEDDPLIYDFERGPEGRQYRLKFKNGAVTEVEEVARG